MSLHGRFPEQWDREVDVVVVGFGAAGAKEDRVFLTNGDKISGTLLRVTADHVEMKTSYGEVKIKRDQVRQIAETKMKDLNANDVEAAMRMVEGTCRSMGVDYPEKTDG